MGNITISLADILWVAGAVVTILAVYKGLKEISLRPKVENHEQRLAALEEGQKTHKSDIEILMNGVFAIVNHEIDGNGIEGLKEARDEMQQHLAKR